MGTFGIDSTKVVEGCTSERNGVFKEFYQRYRCRKLSQSFSRRVHSLRDAASQKVHPWLMMVLLAAADTIYYSLVGIEMLPIILVVIAIPVTFLSVCLLLMFYLFTSPSEDEDTFRLLFTTGGLLRVGVLGITSVLLLFALSRLVSWVQEIDPESGVFLFVLRQMDEIFPTFGVITIFALVVIFSACVCLFTFVANIAIIYVDLIIFYTLAWIFSCFLMLSKYIPWYVLLPLTGLFITLLIALRRQIWTTCRKSSGLFKSDQEL